MTTLTGRDKSALLAIDVQNGVVEGAYNLPAVLENINAAIDKARAAGVPVVWVQHSDEELVLESERWQIVPELTPAVGESKVRKLYRSSFEATDLEEILAGLGVGHIYVTGMQTDNCVRHTTHAAQERGYDITVVADAHSTTGYEWNGHVVDAKAVVDQFNDNFYGSVLPGRFTRAVLTADLTFG
jgi:nicotinamidase-related amidase